MTTPQKNSLGARLRLARTKRGLGSRELARLANLPSEGHISQIEIGRTAMVSAEIAAHLAAALGVPMEWLVSGTGPEPEFSELGGAPEPDFRQGAA